MQTKKVLIQLTILLQNCSRVLLNDTKRHLLTLIGILILFTSCKQKEVEKTKASTEDQKTILKDEAEKKTEENPVFELYIENDSLLSQLESDLYRISLNSKFQINKKPIRNRHMDPDIIQMDTIITYEFDKTMIKFYWTLGEDESWIYESQIENSDFKLLDSISVGIRMGFFETRIKKPLSSNLIKIGNLEQTSVFIFKFENDILQRIDYEGYVD